ncbi:MAG: peptidase rane alanine aminopeptidase [Acidobacteriaceae bacterium]|nr:peptidase rane alanine aminopeptidase [Acidobacteriaceae bacterium]
MMHARMNPITRLLPRCLLLSLVLTLAVGGVDARGQQISNKPLINITGYVIDLTLEPPTHEMHATARVSFTALDTVPVGTFELHSALKVVKVTDENGHALNADRGQSSTIRVTPQSPVAKGDKATWTFTYEGALEGVEGSPVEALKLAAVEDPISYLLYPARWFPMTGYLTDRFTADITVHAPTGYKVLGSGATGAPHSGRDGEVWQFNWDRPGFPGTIVAGKFKDPTAVLGAANIKVYTTAAHDSSAQQYAQTANREYDFFSGTFGPAESARLNVIELPDDTLPAYWAPEMALVAGARIADRNNYRLLANTIARQWWSSMVSPATLNDAWITNGMSRYGELLYVEDVAGKQSLEQAFVDVSAGALAYDTMPLTSAGRLDTFSPQFQSMTLDKGGAVFHMLRGVIGDDAFRKTLTTVASTHRDKSISTHEFQKIAEGASQQQLTSFFAQWLDGTGAPQFTNKYTVYRLGNGTGFRTIGEIQQDLDLFRMPVSLQVQTEGKTESKQVEVSGTDSQYVIDTFGLPRKIAIDPDNQVLKNTPDLQVRIAILRGQQLLSQGDTTAALEEFQNALKANPQSSLANYRIGDVLFTQRNYQAAANAYRDALRGDDEPKWTEVWSHIQLGKIFDVTGQRDRAVNEYRQAVQTNDNTQGAVNQARAYLQKPYVREEAQ